MASPVQTTTNQEKRNAMLWRSLQCQQMDAVWNSKIWGRIHFMCEIRTTSTLIICYAVLRRVPWFIERFTWGFTSKNGSFDWFKMKKKYINIRFSFDIKKFIVYYKLFATIILNRVVQWWTIENVVLLLSHSGIVWIKTFVCRDKNNIVCTQIKRHSFFEYCKHTTL